MANSRSSEKRVRQNERNRKLNRARKSAMNTEVRKLQRAFKANDAGAATEQFRRVARKLDQTAAKGTIHRRTAARRKSRLAKHLNAMSAAKK